MQDDDFDEDDEVFEVMEEDGEDEEPRINPDLFMPLSNGSDDSLFQGPTTSAWAAPKTKPARTTASMMTSSIIPSRFLDYSDQF